MLVKKIIANNYAEALDRVKQELGEEALILSTRSIKYHPEREGAATSNCVEITAALERDTLAIEKPVAAPTHFEESPKLDVAPAPASASLAEATESTGLEPRPEWQTLQPLITTLLSQTDRARSAGLRPEQMELFRLLLESGIEERFALRLFDMLNRGRHISNSNIEDEAAALKHLMKRMMRCEEPLSTEGARPKIIALVGPTGVGKTTTLAKLAAHYSLNLNKKVALISLDTFRMGAFDQLNAYARLMEIPAEQATGRLDFRSIVDRHRDKDLILVDTTGKSHQDLDYARELAAIFKSVPDIQVHLVQSITTQDRVLEQSFEQFQAVKPGRLLITKLDEGVCFGSLFNLAIKTRLPFSYFTTGQKVPEDIEVAAKEQVIRLIFEQKKLTV